MTKPKNTKQPLKSLRGTKQPQDMKGTFLAELIERYQYWSAIGTTQADEYALAYERLINSFTLPEDEK